MRILLKVDYFFLRNTYQLSDWFQSWTGKNNFFLCRVVFLLNVIVNFVAIFLLDGEIRKEPTPDFVRQFSFSFNLFGINTVPFFVLTHAFKAEKWCIKNPKYLNYLTEEWIYLRTLFVLYVPVSAVSMSILSLDFATILALELSFSLLCFLMYLSSVTPDPPSQSKLEKIFSSLLRKISCLVPEPAV